MARKVKEAPMTPDILNKVFELSVYMYVLWYSYVYSYMYGPLEDIVVFRQLISLQMWTLLSPV
jgi:hypothetical protein